MAALKYEEEHNKVGYLLKPTGSNDYHNIIDFLRSSHIRYALTTNPIIFDSLVKQFWSTATLRAPELGPPAILATIDKTPYTIIEELVWRKLTFFKNKFSPQWRFLVHTLLHCLSTKSGSWDQFGSPIAIAFICLSDGRRFNWSHYIFRGMVSNIGNARKFLILSFAGQPMPLLPAMLLQAQAGEGAAVAAQDVPHPMPAPDQSPAHLPTPSRPHTSDHVAPVLKHGHSSNPYTAFVSQSHETDAGPFTTVEDAPMEGDFHASPPRSSHAPPACQPSGSAEDPITLTALSSVVSNLVQKVHLLESELQAYKKLFKDVVGNSSQIPAASLSVPTAGPPGTSGFPPAPSVVPPATFDVPPGPSTIPTGAFTVPAGSPTVPTVVPSRADPTGVFSKGKSPMVEEDIPVKARIFRQMEKARLGKEAAKRLHDEEMAQMERERA
nr:ribonuclease H-like domain-containing protein [Tanacetum cinerariifolium]